MEFPFKAYKLKVSISYTEMLSSFCPSPDLSLIEMHWQVITEQCAAAKGQSENGHQVVLNH